MGAAGGDGAPVDVTSGQVIVAINSPSSATHLGIGASLDSPRRDAEPRARSEPSYGFTNAGCTSTPSGGCGGAKERSPQWSFTTRELFELVQ